MGKQLSGKTASSVANLTGRPITGWPWRTIYVLVLIYINILIYPYIPLKTQRSIFVPFEHAVLQKHTVTCEQKRTDTWETATVEDIADEAYKGPGNVSKCTEMVWMCGLYPTQTQDFVTILKEHKTLLSLPLSVIYTVLEVDSLEHTSRNCWT